MWKSKVKIQSHTASMDVMSLGTPSWHRSHPKGFSDQNTSEISVKLCEILLLFGQAICLAISCIHTNKDIFLYLPTSWAMIWKGKFTFSVPQNVFALVRAVAGLVKPSLLVRERDSAILLVLDIGDKMDACQTSGKLLLGRSELKSQTFIQLFLISVFLVVSYGWLRVHCTGKTFFGILYS